MPLAPLRPRDLIPAGAIGITAFVALAAVSIAPRPGGPAMASFPPWVGPARALALAASVPGWRVLALRNGPLGPQLLLHALAPGTLAPRPPGALLLTRARAGGCLGPAHAGGG